MSKSPTIYVTIAWNQLNKRGEQVSKRKDVPQDKVSSFVQKLNQTADVIPGTCVVSADTFTR
jgi:hypothetical protein